MSLKVKMSSIHKFFFAFLGWIYTSNFPNSEFKKNIYNVHKI